jgi:hypothetical protein
MIVRSHLINHIKSTFLHTSVFPFLFGVQENLLLDFHSQQTTTTTNNNNKVVLFAKEKQRGKER